MNRYSQLLGQAANPTDGWLQLGVSGAIVAVCVWIISWLLALNKELREENRQTNARVIEIAERVLPAIADNTRVLNDVLIEQRAGKDRDNLQRGLDRDQRDLDRNERERRDR
jgi:hypothetical protein